MPTEGRLESIDQFRGFAMITMVLANFLAGVARIPAWLKHAPDVGLTVIDLVAPFFIFAIGLTYGMSARRRLERSGWLAATSHFLSRYLALVGLGVMISMAEEWFGYHEAGPYWGALASIGIAGILTLPTLRLPWWGRLLLGLGLLVGYQVLLDRLWLTAVLGAPHGGLTGSLAWGAMMILSTSLADLFHASGRGRKAFTWASLGVLAAGAGLGFVVAVSKHRVSASYVLISLGISALLFLGFHFLADRYRLRLPLLVSWGKNPILLYVLHLVLLGLFALPDAAWWYTGAPLWLACAQAGFLLAVISLVAWWLDGKGWVFRL